MLQCASYALEMLSHGGLRSHVIAALVTDDTVQLLYYDHSIIIMSPPLNFLEDSSRFVVMLKAITDLSLKQWGYVDKIRPAPLLDNPRKGEDIFNGLELLLKNGTRLKLEGTVFHQHGLIGRGTCVIRATCVEKAHDADDDEAWNGPLIVKLSWPAKSRTSEQVILEQAYKAAGNNEHRWVLKHLPKVLYSEDVDDNILSWALIDRMGSEYEERVLRIMVQEALYPITEQATAPDLALSFREIFKCRYSYLIPWDDDS
jgi:Fungal protein kinase